MMERLDGTDLLTTIGRKPWLVFRCGRRTGEIHARINAGRAPDSLPAVKDVMHRGLARLAPSQPTLAEWVGGILTRLPDGDALCHGDFHPGQLMLWAIDTQRSIGRGPSAETRCSITREREWCSAWESLRQVPSSR
jgi:hypothetical protein